MRAVESEGATVEQAVERALILLDLSRDHVEVEILQEPNDVDGTAVVRVAPRGLSKTDTPPVERRAVVSRETPDGAAKVPSEGFPSEETDQAKSLLAELLGYMNLSCRVEVAEMEEDGQRARLSVSGEDSALVIGRQGQTLDAIELVLNRIVERRLPGSIPITVDAEDYRQRRAQKLADVAFREAGRVRETDRPIALEPMSPRDRRSVHIALRDEPGVVTRSEGEGQFRHIIIEPSRALAPSSSRQRLR
jgi:spoIIIJ-associated protein